MQPDLREAWLEKRKKGQKSEELPSQNKSGLWNTLPAKVLNDTYTLVDDISAMIKNNDFGKSA